MNYALVAALLLIVAVSLGLYLVSVGIRQHKRLPALGLTHAALAICGFIALSLQIAADTSVKLNNAAAFFLVLAIIGGLLVFALHEKGGRPSMPVVVLHAIMGSIGLILISINVFS